MAIVAGGVGTGIFGPGNQSIPPGSALLGRWQQNKITLAAWINPAAGDLNNAFHGLFSTRTFNDATYLYVFGIFQNQGSFFFTNSAHVNTSTLTAGTWYHLAATLVTSATGEIYLNGIQSASAASATYSAIGDLNVFRDPNNSALNGAVEDFAIWSTKLTPIEIAQLAYGVKRPHEIRPQQLIQYEPFDNYVRQGFDYSPWLSWISPGSYAFVPGPLRPKPPYRVLGFPTFLGQGGTAKPDYGFNMPMCGGPM